MSNISSNVVPSHPGFQNQALGLSSFETGIKSGAFGMCLFQPQNVVTLAVPLIRSLHPCEYRNKNFKPPVFEIIADAYKTGVNSLQ
jgi:hypothetical protein